MSDLYMVVRENAEGIFLDEPDFCDSLNEAQKRKREMEQKLRGNPKHANHVIALYELRRIYD